jgi:uncharacterized protein YlxW (UPF0749 family)
MTEPRSPEPTNSPEPTDEETTRISGPVGSAADGDETTKLPEETTRLPDTAPDAEPTTRLPDMSAEETTRIPVAPAEETTRLPVAPAEETTKLSEETTRLPEGAGSSERATAEGPFGGGILGDDGDRTTRVKGNPPPSKKLSATSVVIAALVGLLGFALVVQVRGTSTESTLTSARQDDLVRILSDLDSNENRLRKEIGDLEELKRELTAGSESRQAAKEAAEKRADELGILAGTLPAEGPGLQVRFSGTVRSARILDAVEELRNAGAEAMQISGANGHVVRIIVSSYFTGPDNDITVDGQKLPGPYTITVIGDPATMKTALNIPGGVVATVGSDGGNVIVDEPGTVRVTALASRPNLQYAQPAS